MRSRRRSRHDAFYQSGRGHAVRKPGDHKGGPYSGHRWRMPLVRAPPETLALHVYILIDPAASITQSAITSVVLPGGACCYGDNARKNSTHLRRRGGATMA